MSDDDRIRWFHAHMKAVERSKVEQPTRIEGLNLCRFPAHKQRVRYHMCTICWWEDGDQDQHDQDIVRGGPNGRYSLTEARRNFTAHRDMHHPDDGIDAVPKSDTHRQRLLAYGERVTRGGARLRHPPKESDGLQ